jgi:endonuclease YncB( thermonuclease family)
VDGADHLGEPVRRAARFAAVAAAALLITNALAEDESQVAPASRDVTPSGMTPGPVVDGPLYREPVPPPPPDPPRWRRFFLPETADAATFRADTLTIRVSGVTPPAADELCRLGDGGDWPCGRTALFSLRRFLRGRAVECFFPRPDGVEEVVAPCRVGKTDLGRWLLARGWAKPDGNATDDYRQASHGAACARLGLWRDAERPADCPSN